MKILSMPAVSAPTSFSVISNGTLQNGCTISGNYTAETNQYRISGNATITLPTPISGYSKIVTVMKSNASYTQLKISSAGHTVTSPANTNVNTVNLSINPSDVIGAINLALTPYSDVQFVYDIWLEV